MNIPGIAVLSLIALGAFLTAFVFFTSRERRSARVRAAIVTFALVTTASAIVYAAMASDSAVLEKLLGVLVFMTALAGGAIAGHVNRGATESR